MATMNISLPDDLKAFVDAQVAEHAYGSTSEYLRDLIRKQRDVERACPRFCVTGYPAGDCRSTRRHHEHTQARCSQRVAG